MVWYLLSLSWVICASFHLYIHYGEEFCFITKPSSQEVQFILAKFHSDMI